MSSITIDQAGEGPVLEALQSLAATGSSLAPTMGKIARTLETRVRLGFRSGTSPYGEAWAPISYREGQPLRDTRQLLGSITSDHGDDYATVGTNTEYAPVHQFGFAGMVFVPAHSRRITQAFGKKIPPQTVQVTGHQRKMTVIARPFLPIRGDEFDLPPEWEQSVLAIITKDMEAITNG